jgi:glycosyltransferase involved in cell wall biosynthesis
MKSKSNILYIFHVSSIGGGSFCLLNMIKKLDRNLYNPIVLLKNYGPLYTELEKLGATVILEKSISTVPYNKSVFTILSIKQIFSILRSLKKVKYWIKKTDADIVHLNTMMMYPYAFPAHTLGKRVVIHVREHWPKTEHKFQYRIARKIIQRYSDKIIAINETSKEIVQGSQKAQVVYDWIDFENRNENIDFNKIFGSDFKSLKIFLFLGGIHNIKGSLEIFDVFSHKILSNDVRLLVVGCENKLLVYIGLRRIKKIILHLFNYYSYSDKAKLIAQKDDRIVFMPSTYHVKSLIEQSFCVVSFFTMPHGNLSLAESIWLGRPSIAADTPEAREYSVNGKAALLFKMNSKEEFENKILYALKNEESINKNAIDGKKIVRKKFDTVINSNLINNIYKDLVN